MSQLITFTDYEDLKRRQEEGFRVVFESDAPSILGQEKTFCVKDTDISFKAVCRQISEPWIGRYTYQIDETLK